MREHPLIRIHLLEEIIKSSQAPTPTTDTFHDILDAKVNFQIRVHSLLLQRVEINYFHVKYFLSKQLYLIC